MKKTTKSKKTKKRVSGRLSKRDKEIRNFTKDLHHIYLPNNEAMKKCAKETRIPLSTVQQAQFAAKGSLETHLSIFLNQTGLTIHDLRRLLPSIRKVSKNAPKYSLLQEKFEAVLSKYPVDQVIVIFELMLVKDEVERSLRLKKK